MGVPQEDRHLIFEWSNAMIGADDPEFEGGADGAHAASAALYAYANDLAKQRRGDPRDDIVTKLINAEIDGEQLSELEFDMFMLLLVGRRQRDHPQHHRVGHVGADAAPRAVRVTCATTSTPQLNPAVEEILRWASPVLPLPPHHHRVPPRSTARRSPRATRS